MKENQPIPTAMLLAAGRGSRMRPLSDATPKPLLRVKGKPMIEFSLERLEDAACHIIVNAYYKADTIVDYCRSRHNRKPIDVIVEKEKYDSGGGVLHALPHLGKEPFFLTNGDIVWDDGTAMPALQRLRQTWDSDVMDILLLLIPLERAYGCPAQGDFILNQGGLIDIPRVDIPSVDIPRVNISNQRENQQHYVFSGIQMIHPRVFQSVRQICFPLSYLYTRARENRRLYGLEHRGNWHHVGDIATLEKLRQARE